MMSKILLCLYCILVWNNALANPFLFKAGLNKTDITAYKKGAGMLGYGMSFNVVDTVQTPLFARSFVVENNHEKLVIVVCELCFIPSELKYGVLDILQKQGIKDFSDENVMLMAQHTHSAPGGYCHYASYNMSIPGYIPEVYDSLCAKIARSIIVANQNLIPCNIKLNKGFFPDDWEVAFNRSLAAYNKNKDIKILKPEERNKAVNREMTLLSFEAKQNFPLGSINWFGVHATSLSNDNRLINSDNKGYAATFLEENYFTKNKNYVAAFAQGTAGDVTPKFRYNAKRNWQRGYWEGKHFDDVASAKYNGTLQYKKARNLIEECNNSTVKNGAIKCALRYFDFSQIAVDTIFSHSKKIETTSPSSIGISMLGGALMDGPGAPALVLKLATAGTKVVKFFEIGKAKLFPGEYAEAIKTKYKAQGKKNIVLETGAKKMMGTANVKAVIVPGFADPTVAAFKHFYRKGALQENSWSPQILPVQLVQIGDIILAAFPFEITTTAGRRLKKSIEELYANENIKEVILCPYANSYSGYITTYEEYQVQLYEGGHTVFGAYSLAALQTVFRQLYEVKNIPFASEKNALKPPVFSQEELSKRRFYKIKK